MAGISMQQGKEAAGAAYAAAGTSIAGHRSGVAGAEITQKAAIDSAKLQAISMIISRMGSKLAQYREGHGDALLILS